LKQTLAVIQTYLMKTTFGRKGGGRGIVTASHDVFGSEQKEMRTITTTTATTKSRLTGVLLLDAAAKLLPLVHPRRQGGCKRMPSEDFTKQLSKFFGRTGTD
jgi:hypothetical protein